MSNPLVSVMMPCFEASKTLPMALASLVAQDTPSWECILVDDGSSDHPEEIVAKLDDARIKYYRLERNQGRGVARQYALERCTGEYLCILDADDWWYSNKLSRQLALIANNRSVGLVASAMAVVSPHGNLLGIRGALLNSEDCRPPLPYPRLPRVAWNTCLIDMQSARRARFDPRFRLAQDVDYLIQILKYRSCIVTPYVTYAYCEYSETRAAKVLKATAFTRQMFRKYRREFPVRSRTNEMIALGKEAAYRILFAVGLTDFVLRSRSRAPSVVEAADYEKQHAHTRKIAERLRTA